MAATDHSREIPLHRGPVSGGAEPHRRRRRRFVAGGMVAGAMLALATASSHAFVEHQQLTASDGVVRHWFGSSVATDGQRLAVCHSFFAIDPDDESRSAAYVFAEIEGVWTEVAKLEPSDGNTSFCRNELDLAIDGNTIVAGAGGATVDGNLFYLYSNPNGEEARVTTRFLRSDGEPVEQMVVIPPETRRTIHVNAIDGLASAEVAAEISADVPIVAERAMYFRGFSAGSVARGATALATSWFFAEGATAFFDTFALLGNPGSSDAAVTVRYQLPDGATLSKDYTVPAGRRRTVWVDGEADALASTAVAMQITSTEPIVAERAMWWGPTSASWYERATPRSGRRRPGRSGPWGTARPADRWPKTHICWWRTCRRGPGVRR
jgi:hypothetical protein